MRRVLAAAGAYFAIVFALAFAVGVVRVLVVAPRIGPVWAVLMEAPLVLAASWWAARACATRLRVPGRQVDRLAMGLVAFALLMAAELALAVLVFGQTAAGYFAGMLTLVGGLGLAAQLGFGLIPWLQARLGSHAARMCS